MIDINGRLHSTEKNVNVIAGANEILDDSKNKKQSEINTETYSLVNDINERLDGLSPEQQSALSVATKATNNEIKLGYYICDTPAATAAKVISATGYVLSLGGSIKVKMTNANTVDNATLNINSTSAKALYYAGERASASNTWEAGETVEVYYDGTSYYANNVAGGSGSGDGAFDVSAEYPTSGVEGGNTYTLAGALAVLNINLSANKKKGGMSIKFVQSSDNKYVQYRLMSNEFTTDTTQWAIADEGVYVENSEFVYVKTDAENKILWAIKTDGGIYYGAGIPPQVKDYVDSEIAKATPENYDQVIGFLNGLLGSDTTLQMMLDSLDAKIEAVDGEMDGEINRAINAEAAIANKVSEVTKTSSPEEEDERIILATDEGKEVGSISAKALDDASEVVEFVNENGSETYAKMGVIDDKKGVFAPAYYDINGNPIFEVDTEKDALTIAGKQYKLIPFVETT